MVRSLPETCGVYLFYGADEIPIYIGKSVNLKLRVRSYFGRYDSNNDDHIKRMVATATNIDHITTETELLALLLEDTLIKQYRPFYNKRSNGVEKYRYLSITEVDYPAIHISPTHSGPFRNIYGPFKDKYYADRLIRLLQRLYGIRECKVDDPVSDCRKRSMVYCAGPCNTAISSDDYAKRVVAAEQFLSGEGRTALHQLEESMLRHSEAHQYEQAAELRELHDFASSFVARQHFRQAFLGGLTRIETRDEGSYVFDRGGRCAYLKNVDENWPDQYVNRIDPALTIKSRHELLDRTLLVYQWLRKMGDGATSQFII